MGSGLRTSGARTNDVLSLDTGVHIERCVQVYIVSATESSSVLMETCRIVVTAYVPTAHSFATILPTVLTLLFADCSVYNRT